MDRTIYQFDGHIKYPGIVAAKRALQGLIRDAEEAGNTELAELRKKRYHDLTYLDIELENLIQFPNGRILVCIVARNRGWLRYDLEIGLADMFDILDEYMVPVVMLDTVGQLQEILANKADIENKLVYQRWNKTFGTIVANEGDCNDIPRLLGDIRFSKIERHSEPYDPVTFTSGSVLVEDLSIGAENMAVYIKDQYVPEPPDPEDLDIVRIPMQKGVTTLSFTLNKSYANPVWDIKVVAPELVVGETVIAPDGRSATVDLSLIKGKEYYNGTRAINITVTINGDEWTADKSFSHSPVYFSSYSGQNDINDILTSTLGIGSGGSTTGLKAYGPVDAVYVPEEPGDNIEFSGDFTSQYTSSSTLYLKMRCPVFPVPGTVTYPVLVDGAAADTSNWTKAITGVMMHPPEGATRIIVEPVSLVKGDTEYDFFGTLNVYWNDEAKTPVRNPTYGDLKTTFAPEDPDARRSITTTPTGYKLHFSVLNVNIDTMTVLSKLTSYAYIGYPYAWFEHRYNYSGGDVMLQSWDRMMYSQQRGVFRHVNADGVTMDELFTKVGFQEGIWSTMTTPKRVVDGIGNEITLDMHIVQYNRPAKELSVISLNAGGTQYDVQQEFDYKPMDPGQVVGVHDEANRAFKFTVTVPEGVKAEDLIVERDYDYGDGGSVSRGWIRDATVTSERTVTFTCIASWGTETYYRIWFSNKNDITSSYRWTDTIIHKP